MSLTFAGYDLTPMTPDLMVMMERWWVEQDVPLWTWPGYGQERLHHVPIPDHPSPETTARLNTLVWPTGASRWAVFHSLVGGASAEAITVNCNLATGAIGATLNITDDARPTNTITPTMYVAALRPVYVKGAGRLLWLTLVDQRYYWWMKQATYTFTEGTSWSNLLVNLVTAASGVAPVSYTVNAAYGTPNSLRWTNLQKPLPLLIDAAASTVGLRLVVNLDGTTTFVAPSTAITADAARYTLYGDEVSLGGQNSVQDISGSIPANVAVSYWGDVQSIKTKSLASLALPDYGTVVGVPNKYGWVQADTDARNTSTTYSDQAASDYYKWRLSLTEATFRGILPLTGPTGLEDRLEWEYVPGYRTFAKDAGTPDYDLPSQRLATRVVRWPLADNNLWGDRPPPGYTYTVRLDSTNGTAWKAYIQVVSGSTVVDGPQIGWGANSYCVYAANTVIAGTKGTAVPDPLVSQKWTFIGTDPPTGNPLVRVTSAYTGTGSYTNRYTVLQVVLTGAGPTQTLSDGTMTWAYVIELGDRLLPVSNAPDPTQGVYWLGTAPDGHKYLDVCCVPATPSTSSTSSSSSGSSTSISTGSQSSASSGIQVDCSTFVLPGGSILFSGTSVFITNKTGPCSCLPDSSSIAPGGGGWASGTCEGNIGVFVDCVGGVLTATCGPGGSGIISSATINTDGSGNITSFVIVADYTGVGCCCVGGMGGNARFTFVYP